MAKLAVFTEDDQELDLLTEDVPPYAVVEEIDLQTDAPHDYDAAVTDFNLGCAKLLKDPKKMNLLGALLRKVDCDDPDTVMLLGMWGDDDSGDLNKLKKMLSDGEVFYFSDPDRDLMSMVKRGEIEPEDFKEFVDMEELGNVVFAKMAYKDPDGLANLLIDEGLIDAETVGRQMIADAHKFVYQEADAIAVL